MFLLLLLLISFSFYFVFLTWCLRLHARVLRRPFCVDSGNSMCFSYWKNVRLKPLVIRSLVVSCFRFQLLLKECTIEAWRLCVKNQPRFVSVVIERMYDWSVPLRSAPSCSNQVSVVIERMYDWSWEPNFNTVVSSKFQLLLKECTIEAFSSHSGQHKHMLFQLLLKECTIEAETVEKIASVRLVSVVIERMYDWSSETNWLKINDFWQLVSGLFFENGRSAQKVPLFSKIWGDCLTVFDSCGNI